MRPPPFKATPEHVAKRIEDLITDQDIDDALRTLRDGLRAVQRVRVHAGQPGVGTSYEDQPDHYIRHASAKILLEYRFGKPASTQNISVTKSDTPALSSAELAQRILKSGTDVAQIVDTYLQSMPHAAAAAPEQESKGLLLPPRGMAAAARKRNENATDRT